MIVKNQTSLFLLIIAFLLVSACSPIEEYDDCECHHCADAEFEITYCPEEEIELLDFKVVLYDKAVDEAGEPVWFYNCEPSMLGTGEMEDNYLVYLSLLAKGDCKSQFHKHLTYVGISGASLSTNYPNNHIYSVHTLVTELNQNNAYQGYTAEDGYPYDYRLPLTFTELGLHSVTIQFYQPCQKKWFRLPHIFFNLHADTDNEGQLLCGGKVELIINEEIN